MRVGLFLRNLDEEFQITLFRGIRARARSRGVDLVCIQGETIHTDAESTQRPFALAYDVAFDGLLVLSSVIVDNSESALARKLAHLLPPVPAVSVGLRIPEITSLTFQTKRSLSRILEHLILDHGYRRILYLGGPPEHRDNQVRQRIFVSVLKQFAATWPELAGTIDHGGFSENGGMDAIRRYLGGQPFDAIVAANDNMALGVLKVLRLQDDEAWKRCAVTGFDDIPQAALEDPPLTSVHLPLEQLGALALDTLADHISGKRMAANRTIPSYPVIRESCGCRPVKPPSLDRGTLIDREGLAARLDGIRRSALESEQWLRQGNYFGRDLSGVTNREGLLVRLEEFLSGLAISDFFLLVTENNGSQLIFERRNGLRTALPEGGIPLTPEALFSERPGRVDAWNLCVSHLWSGDAVGIAAYSAGDRSLPHVGAGIPHIAHALKRLKTQAEQEDRNRHLEAMVQARTIQLTEANHALREEVALRTAKELEVRGQRRLLDLILRTLPIPVVVFERGGLIQYANPAFEDRIGGAAIHRSIGVFLDLPAVCEGVEMSLRSGRAGGPTIPVLTYTAGLDFDGRDATLAAMVDLSRQKALEAEVLQISEFERRRFGLDLHDDICQRLAGLTMYLKGFAQRPPRDSAAVWGEVGAMVDETLQLTRRYSHASFPIDLERRGLNVVLKVLCETVSLQHGFPCRFGAGDGAEDFPLEATQALHLYRIVQEALQNAVKHSRATSLEVTLEAGPEALVLRVADNGSGVAAERLGAEGLGFRSMAYRASQLGARFEVSSRPGMGTIVHLEVPRNSSRH